MLKIVIRRNRLCVRREWLYITIQCFLTLELLTLLRHQKLLTTASKLGYNGLAITEHESLSSAVQMIQN